MAAGGRHGRKAGRGYYDYGLDPYRPDDPEPPEPVTDARPPADGEAVAGDGFRAVCVAGATLSSHGPDASTVGYYAVPPIASAPLVELTRAPSTSSEATDAAQRHFERLGKHVEWVGDSPGLVLGRIVCQLVNEAAFALQAGIGSAEDLDTAMRLGFNYPRGPLEWSEAIGLAHVLEVLDGLWAERHEEAYRACPLLRRAVAAGDSRLSSPRQDQRNREGS